MPTSVVAFFQVIHIPVKVEMEKINAWPHDNKHETANLLERKLFLGKQLYIQAD